MSFITNKILEMPGIAISRTVLLVMVSSMIISVSCLKTMTDDQNMPTILPSFNDSIPYTALGQGKLVFERVGPVVNAYNGIYVVDIGQKKKWGIGSEVILDPSVSPDGQSIAYIAYSSDTTLYDIYLMNMDGTNRRDISNMRGQETCPGWLFDGSRILFSRNYYYSSTEMVEAEYRQSPVANPDDRFIVVNYNAIDPPNIIAGRVLVSSSINGKLALIADGLRTYDSDGSNMKLVIPYNENSDHYLFSPAWSPDGTRIAYLSYKENSDIKVVTIDPNGANADTLVSVSVTGNRYWNSIDNKISLCWSPDGSRIAFTRPDGPIDGGVGSHIYVINKDHTGLTQVTFAPEVTDMSLSWSN